MLSSKKPIRRPLGRPAPPHTDASVVRGGKEGSGMPPAVERNAGRGTIVGTLSFPVSKSGALRDNSHIIAEIIRRRSPGLLLCAGFSVPCTKTLRPIKDATRQTGTVAVLETNSPRVSFQIRDGRSISMGEQFYATRDDTNKHPSGLTCLANALSKRSFRFSGRPVLLLVCGEITVIQGRTNVDFHCSAPPKLQDAVRAERVLILNPTHTRMGNSGTIRAWRRFLSAKGRVYVSASNWNVRKTKGRRQKPSPTLHSFWHDRNCSKPCFQIRCIFFDYREWVLRR